MRFSVLSYNVLHSFGAKRLLRGRVGSKNGAWANERLSRVAELVRRADPDIACLQEVDAAAQAELERVLGDDFSCAGVMRNHELPAGDGCATFIRRSRFEVVRSHTCRLRDTLDQQFPDARKRVGGMASALWRELHEKLNVVVALRLRPLGSGCSSAELCVATSHLYFDPKYPDLKLLQAFLLAREVEAFSRDSPLVLAGDLNSTPFAEGGTVGGGALSGVYALLTQGRVAQNHPHHPVHLRPSVGILRGITPADVPELVVTPFRSAYRDANGVEGPITNATQDFHGCLDYIFYRPDGGAGSTTHGSDAGVQRLRLLSVQPLPSEDELLAQLPLPCVAHPSDHLPLLAEFELSTADLTLDMEKQRVG